MAGVPDDLVARVLTGERRAVARLITYAERRDPAAMAAMAKLYPHTGNARVLGVTGPPGSGKSTLVDKLIQHYRARDLTVGVVAVDPTSPFTGGALLGDRVRMQHRTTDPGVFIRSMGTRGWLGGLSRAAHDAIHILDAAGKDVVLVETVGVGQGEVEVVRTVDTVLVLTVPGLGDEVQNFKAGIMEIADAFVVNKSDREGADRTAAEITATLEFGLKDKAWVPPVVRTVAETGDGVPELARVVEEHRVHMETSGELEARRLDRARWEVLDTLKERLLRSVAEGDGGLADVATRVAARKEDPYTAAQRIYDAWRRG